MKTRPVRRRSLGERIPRHATLRKRLVHKRWGPYWYAFWSEGGRTRCEYIGSDANKAELERQWAAQGPPRIRIRARRGVGSP